MKIIKKLSEYIDDELKGAKKYAKCACIILQPLLSQTLTLLWKRSTDIYGQRGLV